MREMLPPEAEPSAMRARAFEAAEDNEGEVSEEVPKLPVGYDPNDDREQFSDHPSMDDM